MPCICYREHAFRGKSRQLLELVKSIVGEYQEQGFDLTLRQAFYQLVARGHIPNSERQYKNLGVLVRNGRLAGLIDWSAIIDRTRGAERNNHFDGPGHILSVAADQYAIDTHADQGWYIEVWIEKDALVGVIEPVCRERDVTYLSCRGYLSTSEIWQSAGRLQAALARGQEPVVLHLGDHDPSGIDMTRAIREGLRLFAGHEIRVERIALNMDQVDQYRPPPNPAKETDSRYKDYVRRFGPRCWELDALDPRVIVGLIRQAVGQYTDDNKRGTLIRRQQGEKHGLDHIAERWRELVTMDGSESGDGKRIWFSLKPPAPLPNTVARWSQAGRTKWMGGHRPDLKGLFQEMFDQFLNFLEFPPEDMVGVVSTLSLWTMLTYAYPAWPAVPYLSIGGPLGSGKSRVFDVLVQLVFNPLPSSNLTGACLFRTLHIQAGTLLLDEAERLRDRTPDVGELLSILLAGYKRGGQATRMERAGDNFTPMSFDVYGPKAIAGISNLPPALASRCIPIMMLRAAGDSIVPRRRIDPTGPIWAELRDDLHCMALAHDISILGMADWQPDSAGLNGRSLELWLPILARAKLVEDAGMDGLVETVERHALKSIESAREEIVPEGDEILLRLLREMSQDKPWGVTANEVLQAAITEEPSLFVKYTARGVAAVFNRYSIKSRRSGGKRYFSATENQWKAIAQSYGIDLALGGHDDGTNGNK